MDYSIKLKHKQVTLISIPSVQYQYNNYIPNTVEPTAEIESQMRLKLLKR